MAPTIAIIDDDPDIVTLLTYNLEREGFTVTSAGDGDAGLRMLHTRKPDLLILDWMLPRTDGLQVLRTVREVPKLQKLPVLMLTAKESEPDTVRALEAGADDYLSKPFRLHELIARVRALLRRQERAAEPKRQMYEALGIIIDFDKRAVQVGGQDVVLTHKEFELLSYLVHRSDKALSRDTLLEDVWDLSYTGGTRTVDVHVQRLRRKLGPAAAHVVTVKNVGYMWDPQALDARNEP
ncbi:MAG TPA: response regulator transcription factor [bacterium]|nr:response regulator transcription factor [bacterium]